MSIVPAKEKQIFFGFILIAQTIPRKTMRMPMSAK
jgi:hypothetical protein